MVLRYFQSKSLGIPKMLLNSFSCNLHESVRLLEVLRRLTHRQCLPGNDGKSVSCVSDTAKASRAWEVFTHRLQTHQNRIAAPERCKEIDTEQQPSRGSRWQQPEKQCRHSGPSLTNKHDPSTAPGELGSDKGRQPFDGPSNEAKGHHQ